jgi:sodium transport system permease protein
MHKIWVVFTKEWRDAWRDKKSLRMTLLMPVYFVGMFVASVLFALHMGNQARATTSEPIKLSVMGAEQLPALMDWLRERGVDVQPVGDDAYQQVEQAKLDYALIIPKDAAEKFATGESVELALVFDMTNSKVHGSLGFVRQQIWNWNGRMGSLRLLARGISPAIVNPVSVRDLNVASDEKMGFFVMLSLPIVLIMTAFMSSVGFTADMVAGERERRSLESLLITPVTSGTLVLGKWLNAFSLTLLVTVVEVFLLALAFHFLPFNELGLRVNVTPLDLLAVFLVLVSVAVIATGLQFLVSIFARSFKDAQTYMGLMVFIPMVPLFYSMFNPSVYADWFRWVPILGQHVLIKDLLLGTQTNLWQFSQVWLVALVLGAALLWFTARQLRKPGIVYGAT